MLHPPDRIIAYLRYFQDKDGPRERLGIKYEKVYNLSARTRLLRANWPKYLYRDRVFNRELQAVPIAKVRRHYLPADKLRQLRHSRSLDSKQNLAIDMATTLASNADVPISRIGVSGSLLVDLHTMKSDIDLIIYGSSAARKCHSTLCTLLDASARGFSPYNRADLRTLYQLRKQTRSMPFRLFLRLEQPKLLQGKFKGTDYFIRCVRDWDEWHESYGSKTCFGMGRSTVQATIGSDTESIFTPSIYELTDSEATGKFPAPTHITSFRGRFCEQAHTGEGVRARGTLEKIVSRSGVGYRLVIGENPTDYLIVTR